MVSKKRSGTEEILDSLRTYGEDVLKTKFPSNVDGLKDVTRRIIWVSKDVKDQEAFISLQANTMKQHVSGDTSVYGAIVRMAQDFMVNKKIIDINGKAGEYYDPSASAAPRYLTASSSEFCRDVFFNGINLKTIPMVPMKEFNGMEPKYLIPKIPMALILGNLTVGFGFKSYTPMFSFNSICDLVAAYSKFYQDKGVGLPPVKSIAKYLVPSFPIDNLIKNRTELIESFSKGDFSTPVKLEGRVELSGSNIVLRSVPYGTDFGSVVHSLRTLLLNTKHPLYDHIVTVNQYSSDVAEVNIELKRGKNPFEVLDKMRSVLRFSNTLHFIFSYTKNERIITLTPPALTYFWYQERYSSIASGLKYKQAELVLRRLMLEAILIVIDHADEVIEIIRASEDKESATRNLYDRFSELTLNQARIIASQEISTLSKSSKRRFEGELEATIQDMETTLSNFERIHCTIQEDAQFLKKKHRDKEVFTRYSEDFLGYVQFSNWGIIHFFTESEMMDILNTKGWPSSIVKTIHWYDPKEPPRYLIVDSKLVPAENLSKEITCEGIVCGNAKSTYTLVINQDGSTSVIERAVTGIYGDFTLFPVTSKFYAIRRNGKVTEEDVNAFSIRKTVSRGAKTDIIYALPNTNRDLVVFHMNSSDINSLRVDRILRDDGLGSIRSVATGTTEILGVYSLHAKNIYLNIPMDCKKNIAVDHIVIPSVEALFNKKKDHLLISLGKNADFNKRFKRHSVVRTMFTMVEEN